MTTVLIVCAGPQDKWGGHLGVRSHLVRDRFGEAILHRTVRQFADLSPVVVCPPDACDDYVVDGAVSACGSGFNELDASRKLWSADGPTIVLLGDTWFSNDAVATIRAHTDPDFRTFGRSRPSAKTGSPWGEIFAHRFTDPHFVAGHIEYVRAAHRRGQAQRHTGWEVLRSIQGGNLNSHKVLSEHFTEIDDLTDDIDFPIDYRRHPMFGGR